VSRGIRKEVFYPDPPETVWVALTDPRAIAEWLMPNNFKAEVGHRFYFQTDPMPMCEARTECEVIECDPPRRLAYTWLIVWRKRYRTEPQPMVVSWTLTPEQGGTRLLFEQSPYSGPRAFWTRFSMNMGWGLMHKKLIPRVLASVRAGEFTPGAVPLAKRHYKARTIPDELVR
jgi:uncharacterized protein YndB with AHSA1/START domain